jgi:hypothetical protein
VEAAVDDRRVRLRQGGEVVSASFEMTDEIGAVLTLMRERGGHAYLRTMAQYAAADALCAAGYARCDGLRSYKMTDSGRALHSEWAPLLGFSLTAVES